MSTIKRENLDEFNYLKGFLIIAVVIGHFTSICAQYMYWFHMPAFFMISGFFLKPISNKTNLIKKIKIKLKSYMLPYFSYLILLSVLSYLIIPNSIDGKHFIRMILGGKWLYGTFGVFWYMTTFSFAYVLFVISISKFRRNSIVIICCLFYILASFESYLIKSNALSINVPGNLDVSILGYVYMALGYLFSKHYHKFKEIVNSQKILIIVFTALLVIFIYVIFDFKFDMKYIKYGTPGLNLIIPILLTLSLLIFSFYLNSLKYDFKYITILGVFTIPIMYIHCFIKEIMLFFGNQSFLLYLIISLILPVVLALIFKRYKFLKTYFLGM